MASDNLDLEDLLNEDFSSGPSTKTGETPSELVQVYEQDALNVLVADPEDSWGRRLENLLRRWFGEFISVSRVNTVVGLTDRLKQLNIDAIVTEVEWPEKDSSLFVDELMAQPGISEIPVVVFSEMDDEMFRVYAFRSGVMDYFPKTRPDLFQVEFRLRNLFRMQFHNKILYRQIDESLHRYQKNRGLSEEEIKDLRELVQVMKDELDREYQNKTRLEEEKKKIQNVFGLYVDPTIINGVMSGDISLELKGVEQDVSVLFSDIRGYTTMAESMDPQSIVSFLNEYFTSMTEVLLGYEALIDKYIGDAIMAVFGAPIGRPDHRDNAMQAAMEMQSVFELWRGNWEKNYGISPHIGIGIASGPATLGNFGSFQKLSYTAIGDTVNTAARLESVAGPGEVAVNHNLYEGLDPAVRDKFVFEEQPPVTLKGKSVPVRVWKVKEQS
ncbi:adenylate/guanylate cyclase domain-containing response regulator [Leptonema illini]|jgi:class 3 adenylate cyclase/DNA-binding response OmpR family regulator|uniref:Adenylate/guanylate cyclase n=1 Tax=Leptonema illini DSM 21528 TaxID=929563 RepID=H2CLC7_9LEPT|nr:adenylate/guanylate cyclase domain-containing response regulator [Leptonema illini]EHQ04538.1 adenylate/guanylate cyclase [Leptonema illini DSM 21528]